MNYLVIKDNIITQICMSLEELLDYLKVSITDNGIIKVTDDRELPISYNMNEYTKKEVIEDIEKYQLKRIECMLQIGIYKLERVK